MEKGHEIKVLDHGFVKLVDWLGSDESVVEAARMSTGRGFVSWESYKRCKRCDVVARTDGGNPRAPSICNEQYAHDWQDFPRGDLGVLDYLYRMGHTSPFEMCELVIDVQVPMDHWRQWIRNRTANVNEYSTRYSEAIDLMARTAPGEWRTQGVTNRQGSGAFLLAGEGSPLLREDRSLSSDGTPVDFSRTEAPGHYLSRQEKDFQAYARQVYEDRLALGVAKEQARKDLPLSTYTAARWKIDLHNLLHNFLGKRMHPHAQVEIRAFANAVAEIVKAIWPRSYALYEEYTLYGVHLSRSEVKALAKLGPGRTVAGEEEASRVLAKLVENVK